MYGGLCSLVLLLSMSSQRAGSTDNFNFHHVADFADDGNYIHLHVFLNTTTLDSQHAELAAILRNASTFRPHHSGNNNYYRQMMRILGRNYRLADQRMDDFKLMLPTSGGTKTERDVLGAIALGLVVQHLRDP